MHQMGNKIESKCSIVYFKSTYLTLHFPGLGYCRQVTSSHHHSPLKTKTGLQFWVSGGWYQTPSSAAQKQGEEQWQETKPQEVPPPHEEEQISNKSRKALEQSTQGCCGDILSGDIQNRTSSCVTCSRSPALEGGLDGMISRGPYQLSRARMIIKK